MEAIILDTDRIRDDAAYKASMRHRCLRDHFFLAGLMGFRDFNERIHRPVAYHYFPKNPELHEDKPTCITLQHEIHNRMQLDPRYTFKTTFGRVDKLQWILAFPEDISILNQSATQPLAEAISRTTAEFLWKPRNKPPTVLQLLWDELVVDKRPDGEWNTTVRRAGEIDKTLAFTSPQTQQSGFHPWIDDPDDMVDTKNSGIKAQHETRQGVIDTYNTNKYTLRPRGFRNIRGTRYHPFDLYGNILQTADPAEWKILIRAACKVKDGARLMPGEFPKPEELELNFPEMVNLTYAALRANFYDHYESFMCQMQNDPQGGNVPSFDDRLYGASLMAPEKVPILGTTVMVYRFPYGGKPFMAKYAEGIVGRIAGDRIYILDAWQGTHTPTNLAEHIIRRVKEWQVDQVIFEDIPGTQYMQIHIENEAHRRNVSVHFHWWMYEEDDYRRFEKIQMLEPMFRSGKIWISTAVTKAIEIRKQFVFFGLVLENGIADCVAKLASEIPWTVMRSEMEEEELRLQKKKIEEAQFNAIFQQRGVKIVDLENRRRAEAHIDAMEQSAYFGLAPLPGGLDG